MIDKQTKSALDGLRQEIHLLAEEIEYQRDRKELETKRVTTERKQQQDDAAFALLIEYDMVDFDND